MTSVFDLTISFLLILKMINWLTIFEKIYANKKIINTSVKLKLFKLKAKYRQIINNIGLIKFSGISPDFICPMPRIIEERISFKEILKAINKHIDKSNKLKFCSNLKLKK